MHAREPPRSVVRAWSSTFAAPESSHNRIILSHEFNSSVRVVVRSAALAASLKDALAGADVFYQGTLSATSVVERSQALEGVSLLSDAAGGASGGAPVLARTKAGAVAVVLAKDAHERLGLPGVVGTDGRWRSQLALSDVTESERARIASLPPQPFVGCFPRNALAADATSLGWSAVRLESELRALLGLLWPHCDADGAALVGDARGPLEVVLEWIGAVAAGATALTTNELRGNQMAPLFCAYRLDGLDADNGAAALTSYVVSWSGLLSADSCAHVLDVLRASLDPSECAAMIVSGFEHAPVTWGATPHHGSFFASTVCTKYAFFLQPGGHRYYGFVIGDGTSLPL